MRKRNEQILCAGCGTALWRGQLICPECGTARQPESLTRCRHCGTLNRRERRTCIACDLPLGVPWLSVIGAAPALLLVTAMLFAAGPWLRARLAPVAEPGATAVAESTPEVTATSAAPSATATPTPGPTATLTPTPTASPSPSATSTPTASPSSTPTMTATDTPTATPTEQAPTASPTPFIYVVKAGDNLFDIAIRFDVTVAAIKKANGLKNDNLRIGQKLIIPPPG